ncbi:hypothetical protein JTB14_016141 [Gonioctena quinquepunctata]|nr:hypothetical protein JTB14_016141 [Gonioctena quinquepunctata]
MHVESKSMREWQTQWQTTTKGRATYELIPRVEEWVSSKTPHLSKKACSVMTSHGNFGIHLHRIGKIQDPECRQCPLPDSPAHRMTTCPAFEGPRV